MLFKRMFSPLILSFSRVGTIVIISILPSTVVSIMYYRLFCCSTVPYNNTERVSFVTSWTEQVNVTTVTTVKDDPCRFIFRPWLCKHNITDTRLNFLLDDIWNIGFHVAGLTRKYTNWQFHQTDILHLLYAIRCTMNKYFWRPFLVFRVL